MRAGRARSAHKEDAASALRVDRGIAVRPERDAVAKLPSEEQRQEVAARSLIARQCAELDTTNEAQ